MFFSASKLLARVGDPAAWALALAAGALLLALLRRIAAARVLAILAATLMGAFSAPALANSLQRWLESSARSTFRADTVYDAVIVLGGGDRLGAGLDVIRAGRARNLMYSESLTPREVDLLIGRLRSWGVGQEKLVIESQSRNTHENAVEAARLVTARGWHFILLVTSAAHVERALGCFRRAGLAPDVLPVEYLGEDASRAGWIPNRCALQQTRTIMHEVIGRVVYRILGYSE